MNRCLVVLCLLVALALGEPEAGMPNALYGRHYGRVTTGYGRGGYGGYGRTYSYQQKSHPICKTLFDVTTTKECASVPEKVCNTVTEKQVKTELEDVCETVNENVCKEVMKQVPDMTCTTTHHQECVTESHPVIETAYVDECHDIKTQVCEETGLVGVGRKLSVLPVAGRAIHGGLRAFGAFGAVGGPHPIIKREADAQGFIGGVGVVGAAPRCRAQVRRACNKRPVQKKRLVSVPKCTTVPRSQCTETMRDVTETVCDDVPKEVCSQVEKEVEIEVPRQDCKDVPRQVCRSVPNKVARRVCKEVATSVHGYKHGLGHSYGY